LKLGRTRRELLATCSSSEITEIMAYHVLQERDMQKPQSVDRPPEDLDAKSRSFFGKPR
jgi:hypothetical protein